MSRRNGLEFRANMEMKRMETSIHESRRELSSLTRTVNQLTISTKGLGTDMNRISEDISELRKLTSEGFGKQQNLTDLLYAMVSKMEKKCIQQIKSDDVLLNSRKNEEFHMRQESNRNDVTFTSGSHEEQAATNDISPAFKSNMTTNDCGLQIPSQTQHKQRYQNPPTNANQIYQIDNKSIQYVPHYHNLNYNHNTMIPQPINMCQPAIYYSLINPAVSLRRSKRMRGSPASKKTHEQRGTSPRNLSSRMRFVSQELPNFIAKGL